MLIGFKWLMIGCSSEAAVNTVMNCWVSQMEERHVVFLNLHILVTPWYLLSLS
jgi:hypothetical protein